jgi:hypothetical protein
MKYRIIQVYDTPIDEWYRLQQSVDGDHWEFLSCDSNKEKLVKTMERLVANKAPDVVAEASS